MLAYSMPDDEADYLEDDENVLIEEKFFENGKCRLYDLGGEEEEDNDEYVCQCQIITEHQFTLFTLSCEGIKKEGLTLLLRMDNPFILQNSLVFFRKPHLRGIRSFAIYPCHS